MTLSSLTGLNEQQPNFSLSQTIAISETLSWIHGKHNLRFGGDYRRVHRDFLGGSNATGTFTFSGLFTEDAAHDATTGSSLADFLLGLPQETAIDSAQAKSYLRENEWMLYATDDWRARNNLTLNYGLRYEYFAPYTEKYGRLAIVDTNPATNASFPVLFGVADEVQAGGAGSYNGKLPDSLVHPYHTALAPRVGAGSAPSETDCGARRLRHQLHQRSSTHRLPSTMARQPMKSINLRS
jgi:outer membrane receptor protein involved in Fe transport